MRHGQIVESLCDALAEGDGINEACASLNITTDYLADHLRPRDRVRLHQSRMLYVEGLERTCAQRASAGRNTFELRRTIYHLRTEGRLVLPGDDVSTLAPEERVPRRVQLRPGPDRRTVEKSPLHDPLFDDLAEVLDLAGRVRPLALQDDEEDGEDPPQSPKSPTSRPRPRPRLPPEAVEPTCSRLRGAARPSSDPPPAPEPSPAPRLAYRRGFTGRIRVLEEDTGRQIDVIEPGAPGYDATLSQCIRAEEKLRKELDT